MLDAKDFTAFIDTCCQRDKADFNLDGMIEKVRNSAGKTLDSDVFTLLTMLLRDLGPQIFETGFYAGATAGMQAARDIYK